MTFLNDHFNTTTDLVNLVNSTKLDFIYKRDKRDPAYNSSIKIAINYQNVDPTTAMSKKFLYNLISIIEDRNLDIWLVITLSCLSITLNNNSSAKLSHTTIFFATLPQRAATRKNSNSLKDAMTK